MSDSTIQGLTDERNHWIGEAKRYQRLYEYERGNASLFFRQRNEARQEVERLLSELGFCPECREPMPCTTCGAGL